MLIRLDTLRERLHGVVLNKGEQGHDIEGLQNELDSLPDSYDVFVNFTKRMDLLNGIEMGILPDRVKLMDEEKNEREYLNKYFKTLKELFPTLAAKWNRRSV